MMNVMLYEQVKNLYFNYVAIKPLHTCKGLTCGGGEEDGTTRENKGNHREVGKGDRGTL